MQKHVEPNCLVAAGIIVSSLVGNAHTCCSVCRKLNHHDNSSTPWQPPLMDVSWCLYSNHFFKCNCCWETLFYTLHLGLKKGGGSAKMGRPVSILEASRGGGERLKSVCNHDMPVLTIQGKKILWSEKCSTSWLRLGEAAGERWKETAATQHRRETQHSTLASTMWQWQGNTSFTRQKSRADPGSNGLIE